MKIRKKFLQLTRLTYPYGTEHYLESYLPSGYKSDNFGNYYLSVGENYSTMFTCHLDTSCSKLEKVTHDFFGNYIMTDGTTILGADDKAGMIVVLYMIENKVPGLYYFFTGEEVGCIGSSDLADGFEKKLQYPEELDKIKKVVSFDRRGTTSVITDQFYGTCCSDEFALALCTQFNTAGFGLNMRPDPTGVLTDSAQFMGCIPECTNISVGYYDEHTHKERQDIDHLYKLCKSCVVVDWESLPISREPGLDWRHLDNPYEDYYETGEWQSGGDPVGKIAKSEKLDSEYSEKLFTYVVSNAETGMTVKAYLSQTWINHEKLKIMDMLKKQGKKVSEINWNGTSCWINEVDDIMDMGGGDVFDTDGDRATTYLGNRSTLIDFIPTFANIPVAHIKYSLKDDPKPIGNQKELTEWENPNLRNLWDGVPGFIG